MLRNPAARAWRPLLACTLLAASVSHCAPDERQAAEAHRDAVARRVADYEQKRTDECEQRYREETARHSNVVSWKYDREVDGCWVEYRHEPPVSAAYCDSTYPPAETSFLDQRLLCHEGRYRHRF